jgi:hypothetical protein
MQRINVSPRISNRLLKEQSQLEFLVTNFPVQMRTKDNYKKAIVEEETIPVSLTKSWLVTVRMVK